MKPTKTFFYKFLAICILGCMVSTACRKQEVPKTLTLHAQVFKQDKRIDSLMLAKNKVSKQKVNSLEICTYSITPDWTLNLVIADPSTAQMFEDLTNYLFDYYLVDLMYQNGATAVYPEVGTKKFTYVGQDLKDMANGLVYQALQQAIFQIPYYIQQLTILSYRADPASTCYPNQYNNPAGGGGYIGDMPAIDPCAAAKDLTSSWNKALAADEVKNQLATLKGMVNSSIEHGFLITLDATGYHASDIITGNASSTTFNVPSDNTVLFVVHSHPGGSLAPSSTDILGLPGFGTGLGGDIIMAGDGMTLVSVTDPDKYRAFAKQDSLKGYKDATTKNGWKNKSNLSDAFNSFTVDFSQLNPNANDATLPAQLYLIDKFKMGVTVQQWGADNKFHPLSVDSQPNVSTGSGTTMSGGGDIINSRYSSIQVSSKNCN